MVCQGDLSSEMKVRLEYWWSHLQGTAEEVEQVKAVLSFQSPAAKYSRLYQTGRWDGMVKLYRSISFASVAVRTGLLSYTMSRLSTLTWEIDDRRQRLTVSGDIGSLSPQLRDYQEEAVVACLRQQWGIVSVPTGGGKTHIGAAIFKGFGERKALYLVHRGLLARQIRTYMREVLGEEVGFCAEGELVLSSRVVVGLVQSLYSKGKGSETVRQWLASVEVVVIDECHHSGSPMYKGVLDLCSSARVCIGLSGTVPTEESVEALEVRGVLGEVISLVTSKELKERGFVVAPIVTMFKGSWEVGLKEKLRRIPWGSKGTETIWQDLRQWSIIENDKRNEVVCSVVERYSSQGGVLVIVDLVQHGETLSRLLGCSLMWANSVGKDQLWEDFKSGKVPVMVCSPLLDEGMDAVGIKAVVLAGGGKSRRQLLQRIGRGMRKAKGKYFVRVVDFYDSEIPLLQRHTDHRMAVYEKEGFEVEEVVV